MIVNTPIGKLGITLQGSAVTNVCLLASDDTALTDHSAHIEDELLAYFNNPKHTFNVTINATGTPFQQRVWNAICKIPSGTTLTYGELAKQLNSSPRAVGQACRKNPAPVIVPCHRVRGAKELGGYSGDLDGPLFAIKCRLLEHEGVHIT